MRWSTAVDQRDRLEGTSAKLHMRRRLNQAQRRYSVTRCSTAVKGVLPSAQEFSARLRSRANIKHLFLRIGIGAQFINAAGVVNVNVSDQRAVQSRDTSA